MSWVLHSLEMDALSLSSQPRHLHGEDIRIVWQVRKPPEGKRLSAVISQPIEKLLSGEQEARIIATRLGSPPPGYAHWTLRLLARKVVELGIVESVSYETVRRTLQKTVPHQPAFFIVLCL